VAGEIFYRYPRGFAKLIKEQIVRTSSQRQYQNLLIKLRAHPEGRGNLFGDTPNFLIENYFLPDNNEKFNKKYYFWKQYN